MHLLTGFFLAGDDLEEEEEEELRDLEPVFDQVLLPTRNSCALVRHSSLVGGGAGAAFPERLQDGWGPRGNESRATPAVNAGGELGFAQ